MDYFDGQIFNTNSDLHNFDNFEKIMDKDGILLFENFVDFTED